MAFIHDSSISLDLSIGTFHPLKYHHEKARNDKEEVIINPSYKEKADMEEEMKRAVEENRRLTAMLAVVCERHRALRAEVLGLISSRSLPAKKRMRKSGGAKQIEAGNGSCKELINASCYGSNCRQVAEEARPRVSKLYIRADGLVVRDGYHWRKYGQKVIRDNAYPRAYFRCSFAPVCPVKKKVQRCTEDHSVLVVTYEGEHNHIQPSPSDSLNGMS